MNTAGKYACVGAVFDRDAQRSRMHLQNLALHVLAVINQRQILPLARCLAFDLD